MAILRILVTVTPKSILIYFTEGTMILSARKSSTVVRMQCRESVILLSFLWALGLACGLYFISSSDAYLYDLFYSASCNRISILGILVVIFLPIAISAIAVFCSAPFLIYTLCIFKAFCFSVVLCGVVAAFRYSGWLVRLFLLFSDSSIAVLLFWLWCRILSPDHNAIHRDFMISSAIAAGVGLVDYFLVSPYLALLMNYS